MVRSVADINTDMSQRDKLDAARDAASELGQKASELGDGYSDAADKKQITQHDKDIAEGDFRRTEGELRQRDEEVRGATEAEGQDGRRIRDEERQYDQSAARLDALRDQYDYTKHYNIEAFLAQLQHDLDEAYNKSVNNSAENFITAWAIFNKTSYAILGAIGVQAPNYDTRLDLDRLETHGGQAPEWVRLQGEVESAEKDLDAQRKKITDQNNDPYYRDRIADAQQRQAEKASEHATNQSADGAATAALESARKVADKAREDLRVAQREEEKQKLDKVGPAERKLQELLEERDAATRRTT